MDGAATAGRGTFGTLSAAWAAASLRAFSPRGVAMKHSIRLPLALLALAVLSACNQTATPPEPAATAQVEAPAAGPAPVAPQPAATAGDDYALTMANVEAYFKAQQKLAEAAQADPMLEDLTMNVSQEDGVQYAARLEANQKVRAIIADAGLSTRDFALTGETLLTALLAQGALESGALKELPEGMDPASVEFVKQNKVQIEAMMKSLAGTGAK
jgi:hypothetical protein